jgi:hypothetical protein
MTASPQKTNLPSQLDDLVRQLGLCSERATAVVAQLTPEQLAKRPAPESWSIAECITHLTLSNRPYPPLLRAAYAEGRRAGRLGSGPFKEGLMGRLLKWSLEPPPRLKFKANAPFQPVEFGPAERVLPDFLALQEQIEACVHEAAGLAIDQVKVVSPVDTRVKYNAFAALQIVAAHERRHLWQAEQARKKLFG